MSIAITDDHQALSETVAAFLARHDARGRARALLEAPDEPLPGFWTELCALGWGGLHVPEELGGSGFGLPELVVVVEALGAAIAPGPFVPGAIAGAVLVATAASEQRHRFLPGLAAGTTLAGVALTGELEWHGDAVRGTAVVLAGGPATLVMVPVGDDVAIVETDSPGTSIEIPPNLDPTRRAVRARFDDAPAERIPGARRALVDLGRTILAAEAVGIARACTEQASAYAKVREQFGRPIATFQAVKHHCANMLVATELATAAVWDAARAAATGGDQHRLAAAMAAVLAAKAADLTAQLNIQVHGGIGFTWEHDAHLYLRRAAVLGALLEPHAAGAEVTDLTRAGVRRERSVDLPPEAQAFRAEVRAFVESIEGLDGDARRDALLDAGYAVPHWPKPWGRDASAVEQLVIEQELAAAGIEVPRYGITGWVILTLIQHATPEQVERWVRPALRQEVIWCQLFSEPDAGSDAAGIKTRGTRVEGGWRVSGQKVWTSGAHLARYGFATVRTDPDAPKHQGITTMVIDMQADGVTVRPLRMPTGASEFNEVFLDNVFVPDDDVVGPVNGGWTVARATLGNESVSIGGGEGSMAVPVEQLVGAFDAHPERLPGGAARLGCHIAASEAIATLNLRRAHRAVAGGEPGPEGNVTKLVLSENGHEAAAILAALAGADLAFLDGPGAAAGMAVLMHRALSIAGGTSEIKRNQIGERILGLPRDPLLR